MISIVRENYERMVESYTGIEPFTALGWFIIGLLYEEKDLLPSNCRIEVAAPPGFRRC